MLLLGGLLAGGLLARLRPALGLLLCLLALAASLLALLLRLLLGAPAALLGLLFLVAAIVLTGLAARRKTEAGGGAGVRVATGLISVLLVAYVVAIWAMTTKPV